MKILPCNGSQRIILNPGEYYASRKPEIISTLLGSCVSACLFDADNGVFGMNHFLLAYHRHLQSMPILQSDEGRYGIYAMELLINQMMKLGANRLNLKAKCFGGANVLSLREDRMNKATVGEVNVEFIKEFLQNEKIPLLSSSFGGKHGMNLHFVGGSYSAYIKKIGHQDERILEKQERSYWRQSIAEYDSAKSAVDIW